MEATLDNLASTIHPHPTLSENLVEAAEATMGKAIHILNPKLWICKKKYYLSQKEA